MLKEKIAQRTEEFRIFTKKYNTTVQSATMSTPFQIPLKTKEHYVYWELLDE